MKKFISILLALIMALMMCMPTAVAVETDTDSRQSTSAVECFSEDGTINAIFNRFKEIFNYIKDFFESLIDWIKSEIFPPEDGDGDEETTNPPNEDGGEVDPPEEGEAESFLIRFYNGKCINGNPNAMMAFKQVSVQAGTKVAVEVSIPEKTGYKFIGWKPAIPDIMPSHDVECIAQWEQLKGYSTIYIDITEDATLPDYTWIYGEATQKVGTEIKEPTTPIKTNYAFDGWANEKGEKVEFPKTMPEENMKLTAIWRKKTDVKITWVMREQHEDGIQVIEKSYDHWYDYGEVIEEPFIVDNIPHYHENGLYYYFIGWSEYPEIATEDGVYVAQYEGRDKLIW